VLTLPFDDIPPKHHQAARYTAAVLHALAREEAAGRRPRRLLEENRATWARFRGRLDESALFALVLEDAAVTQPSPFDARAMFQTNDPLGALPAALVVQWLGALSSLTLDAPTAEYVLAQARFLGLPTRLARSNLPRVEPHQRVLEAPGTGGQAALHCVQNATGVTLQDVFTVACGTLEEETLAGLIAVECRVTGRAPIVRDPKLDAARARGAEFDLVVALDPSKGGIWTAGQLAEYFQKPAKNILLV
jgi:hypothetical protein